LQEGAINTIVAKVEGVSMTTAAQAVCFFVDPVLTVVCLQEAVFDTIVAKCSCSMLYLRTCSVVFVP
jgi:hypothetical protein